MIIINIEYTLRDVDLTMYICYCNKAFDYVHKSLEKYLNLTGNKTVYTLTIHT